MSEEKPAVLVVEDEESIRRGVCDVLAFQGYAPTGVGTGEEGLLEALTGRYALLVLDLMLPGMSGYDVCDGVRQKLPAQPILMLTARGSEEDILEGFKHGADDYVTKPFSVSEFVARVKALMRRAGGTAPAETIDTFEFAGWQVDVAAARARHGDTRIDLTPRELAIMALFHREAGRIVSRRMLLHDIWGFENPEKIETRTVDMQIGKLRKKLDRGAGSQIETVRGAGYRYGSV
ncbi:MAG: response regulator transcription factor [Myxococcales bacterium]|nr:response regulator transcription factor [Myxococcales bacterium]